MLFLLAAAFARALASQTGAGHCVTVGQLCDFQPSRLTANVGDTIIFNFNAGDYIVSETSLKSPCYAESQRGNLYIPAYGDTSAKVLVTSSVPQYLYCQNSTADSCTPTNLFTINPRDSTQHETIGPSSSSSASTSSTISQGLSGIAPRSSASTGLYTAAKKSTQVVSMPLWTDRATSMQARSVSSSNANTWVSASSPFMMGSYLQTASSFASPNTQPIYPSSLVASCATTRVTRMLTSSATSCLTTAVATALSQVLPCSSGGQDSGPVPTCPTLAIPDVVTSLTVVTIDSAGNTYNPITIVTKTQYVDVMTGSVTDTLYPQATSGATSSTSTPTLTANFQFTDYMPQADLAPCTGTLSQGSSNLPLPSASASTYYPAQLTPMKSAVSSEGRSIDPMQRWFYAILLVTACLQ